MLQLGYLLLSNFRFFRNFSLGQAKALSDLKYLHRKLGQLLFFLKTACESGPAEVCLQGEL